VEGKHCQAFCQTWSVHRQCTLYAVVATGIHPCLILDHIHHLVDVLDQVRQHKYNNKRLLDAGNICFRHMFVLGSIWWWKVLIEKVFFLNQNCLVLAPFPLVNWTSHTSLSINCSLWNEKIKLATGSGMYVPHVYLTVLRGNGICMQLLSNKLLLVYSAV